ncbi:aspartyl/asparaginyl beta-hydroxylase domain-containing protein [Sphingoaurantiacus capsulatus]|uniref:Aspartyl/asparaginyl beta-hydroxylase domain-containing protein n=1 Tax=Sphingoaurantiacus capsulatus TaxID=1771310 RepID=A0ABV7X802_9SPHN
MSGSGGAAETPQQLNAAGVQALGSGEPARAADFFRRAIAADPQAPALWLNLAKAQRELGDVEGERAALNSALAVDARHFMALLRRAELEERLGELGQAAVSWSAVLQVAPPPDQRPPALAELLDHGQAFVTQQCAALGAAVDAGLAATRAAAGDAELRRVDAAIDATLGRRRIYTNDCAGLHFPFLPADEYFPRRRFPWMAELEAATDAIRAELVDLLTHGDEGFVPYVSMPPGAPQTKWTPLDNSLAWGAYYLWKYGEPVEAALKRCPATAAALAKVPRAELPARAPTAFFSVLRPRTHIPPHTGVTNVRTIVHLPLIVPPGCQFRVGGETREWKVGEAFGFDDTIEHEAWNNSDELRAVLILDVWNPHLTEIEQKMVREFFLVADSSGHAPERREDYAS